VKILQPVIRTTGTHPLPALLIHDMRTPLSQIIGYSEMMIEQAEDGSAEDMVQHLEKIRAAGYRLLEIMNNNFTPIATPAIEEIAAILKSPVPVRVEP
jgi:signal transduction histidine kinase